MIVGLLVKQLHGTDIETYTKKLKQTKISNLHTDFDEDDSSYSDDASGYVFSWTSLYLYVDFWNFFNSFSSRNNFLFVYITVTTNSIFVFLFFPFILQYFFLVREKLYALHHLALFTSFEREYFKLWTKTTKQNNQQTDWGGER